MYSTYSYPSSSDASDPVVRALADHVDAEPASLETPLYDVVAPDALDAPFEEQPRPAVRFGCRDAWVAARPDRDVADERPEVPAQ